MEDQVDIKPIRTDEDHTEALKEIERLWGAPLGTADGDRLDVLATLAHEYEARRWPIEPCDPVDMLKFMMEQNDRTQADLADLLGSRSRASEILNRKRPMTLEQIRKISKAWHIPVALLVGELEDA